MDGFVLGDAGDAAVRVSIETTQTLDIMLHQILNQALVAIGAKAGSLMLVDGKQGILQIKARLGEPRPGRTSERVFRIGDDSIAGRVVQHQRSYVSSDVRVDASFAPSRSGQNFLSLLSVPIVHEDKVVAVINADSEQASHFGERHQRILERVAAQVARPIAERVSLIDALGQVGAELTRLPKEGGVGQVLRTITDLAVRSLGADVVTLYEYDQDKDEFLVEGTGPVIGGAIIEPYLMRHRVDPGDVPWTMVKERKSGFYSDVHGQDFLTREVKHFDAGLRRRFVAREGIKSAAALLLPFKAAEVESEEVVGVMFANYRSPHSFNIDEISALATFADYAAVAILNARHEERRHIEQVRLVESISANFAHRMSNLAGPIRVAAQLLRERVRTDDGIARRQLDKIEREADLLLELAERLVHRFLEPDSAISRQVIPIAELLEEELQRLDIDSRVQLVIDIDPHLLPRVQSVEFQLRQVLRDIMNNALEAMTSQESGTLTVRSRHHPARNLVEVEISDSGVGIPEEIRDRLFAPGVSTKGEKLGIGLWYSRTFMQATGGDVYLRDTPRGTGATFVIEIPCAPASAGSDVRAPHADGKYADILIVDDMPGWRETLVDSLAGEGFSIRTAGNFREAYAAAGAMRFALAVLDVRLADGDEGNRDGVRLLTALDELGQPTRVIMITGHTDREADDAIMRHGDRVIGRVSKATFDVAQFRAQVRAALGAAGSADA